MLNHQILHQRLTNHNHTDEHLLIVLNKKIKSPRYNVRTFPNNIYLLFKAVTDRKCLGNRSICLQLKAMRE